MKIIKADIGQHCHTCECLIGVADKVLEFIYDDVYYGEAVGHICKGCIDKAHKEMSV